MAEEAAGSAVGGVRSAQVVRSDRGETESSQPIVRHIAGPTALISHLHAPDGSRVVQQNTVSCLPTDGMMMMEVFQSDCKAECLRYNFLTADTASSVSPVIQLSCNATGLRRLLADTIAMPKRLRDGQTKISTKDQGNVQNGVLDADLEKEIIALGGSKEDYDLITGAPSDSEYEDVESKKISEKALQKDLKRLVQELGIEKAAAQELGKAIHSDQESEDAQDEGEVSAPDERQGRTIKAGRGNTQFPAQSEWHSTELPPLPAAPGSVKGLPLDLIERIHAHAKALLEVENNEYGSRNKSATSAHQFYSTIMSSGTLSDKISALTLSVQESPVHNMKALETLLGLAGKRSRSQAVEVLGALKDLFGPGALLPSDRKLRLFANQPGLSAAFAQAKPNWTAGNPLPKPLKEVHLISWAYEDWLKSTYFEVIKIIEVWCNDEVVFSRGKAVDYVSQLLREKPEQEANLLRLLVNKLGDSDKKIASKTSYNLLQLQIPHPLMKSTIISAIESDLLFRPGQNLHAKYYAIITLNQTTLSVKQDDVTKQLLKIYFSLFAQLLAKPKTDTPADVIAINKKGEIQGGGGLSGKKAQKKLALQERSTATDDQLREKVISAVLTGVNRATPYTNTNDEAFEKHLDTLFKVTHSSNFNTSIQALMLIQQLVTGHPGSADRFYRTLYESLLDPRLLTTSKQALYLNLLFKALRSDLNIKRVKAFMKRLLQIIPMHQPPFACAAIYLIRELESVFPSLQAFIDRAEEGESDEEEVFQDVQDENEISEPRKANGTRIGDRGNVRIIYDGRKRDPQHSNAEHSCFWEVVSS